MIAESCKSLASNTAPRSVWLEGKLVREEFLVLADRMIRSGLSLSDWLAIQKKVYATAAISLARGNRCKAARMLGTHRNTLLRIVGKKP